MVSIKACKAAVIAVVLAVGTTLGAAPQASAAASANGLPIQGGLEPYAVFAQSPGGALAGVDSTTGPISVSASLAPGTSPSAAPMPGGYQYVWQGANNDLWTSMYGVDDLGFVKMAAGTSPSLLTFPDGKWVVAYHATNGVMYLNGSGGLLNMTYTLAPGTSPALGVTPAEYTPTGPTFVDSYTMAWQGSNGHLWLWQPPYNAVDTGQVMAPGTSPSVTRLVNTPEINGRNYYVAYQGANGHLWTLTGATGATAHDTGLAMASGTSPTIHTTAYVGSTQYDPIAFQGANGDLWVADADGDTGLAMMAGTSPSLMVTPVDEPGMPLEGSAAYAAYTSATGAVWLYEYDYVDSSNIEQPVGLTAAGGTSPAIVSALNETDGGWVTETATAPTTAHVPSTSASTSTSTSTSTAAVPAALKPPPAKATVKPMLVAPALSSTCPAVTAHLKQYAARGIKAVNCMTVAPASPAASIRAGTRATSADSTCGVGTWVITRTEECIDNEEVIWTTWDTSTSEELGQADFLFDQDIILQTATTQPVENDTISFSGGWGLTYEAGEVTWTATCSSPCAVLSGGTTTFATAPNKTQGNIHIVYSDTPGTQSPDTFGVSYSMLLFGQAGTYPTGPDLWNLPKPLRCDDIYPGNMGPGCVVPSYDPVLVLPLSVYGAAAMNVYVGEYFLPGSPGLSPLTRGSPATSVSNRTAVCNIFTPLATVPGDSCDEYPFAATQQSGGALGLTGANCLQVLPYQLANGNWTYQFLNKYTGAAPQLCETGHVNGSLNSKVGVALSTLYTVNRMLIGDPFTVQITS